MNKKSEAFRDGMIAGAKPFEDKFMQLGEKVDHAFLNLSSKIEEEYEMQNIINDYFNENINDIQKKVLFDLMTLYDIKDEEVLDSNEQEYLVSYLLTLAGQMENVTLYQQQFIRSVAKYLDIAAESREVSLEGVENIQKTSGQQAFLQVVLEFLFLKNETFEFLDKYEDVLSCFLVNSKKRKEIIERISNVYKATGAQGIAEKYGFVPEEIEEKILEEPYVYDGSDISKECADRVNINEYIELRDYLVYWKVNTNKENELVRVSKSTGEEIVLDSSILQLDTNSQERDDFANFISCYHNLREVRGYDKYLYKVNEEGNIKYICKYDVETFDVKKIELECSNEFTSCTSLCVNENYIVYGVNRDLFYYDINNNMKTKVAEKCSSFYLAENSIVYYAFSDYENDYGCYYFIYDIVSQEKRKIRSHDFMGLKHLDEDSTFYIKNIVCTFNRLTRLESDLVIALIDVTNPLTVQEVQISTGVEQKHIFWAYGKIYYVTLDMYRELWCYDVLDGSHKLLTKDLPAIKSVESGRVFKKMTYFPPKTIQVVGKWIYFRANLSDSWEVFSLE